MLVAVFGASGRTGDNSQLGRRIGGAFDHCERNRPQLVVPHCGGDLPDNFLSEADFIAGNRQHSLRTVEMQKHETTRRVAQVVHLGDRLLAAVTPFTQVHCRTQPIQFVRQRLGVNFGRETRAPGGHTQRLERQSSGDGRTSTSTSRDLSEVGARDEALAVSPLVRRMLRRSRVLETPGHQRFPRVAPNQRHAVGHGERQRRLAEGSDGGEVCAAVGDFDAQHEAHPVQPGFEGRCLIGIHQDPGGFAVIDNS